MNELDKYQNEAMVFRLDTASPEYAILNLPGEVGELCSLIAKGIRDGVKKDHSELVKKELGDILWCVAAIAADYNFNLGNVADTNIRKLIDRQKRNVLSGEGDYR